MTDREAPELLDYRFGQPAIGPPSNHGTSTPSTMATIIERRCSPNTRRQSRPSYTVDGIFLGSYTELVEIEFDREFETWLQNLIKAKDEDPDSRLRLELALALLGVVRDLTAPPAEESATLKRVRQCRRHPVWRLAHHYIPGVAIRVLCWFPDHTTVVVVLVGGDKGPIGDVWYGSAAERAERAIERWQREQETS